MTATQKKILKDLGEEGAWLESNSGETVRVRNKIGGILRYTTRKTIRAMVRQGLLTTGWTLPHQ